MSCRNHLGDTEERPTDTNVDTCSGYTLPFISATVFRETAGSKFLAAIFKLITIFVPLADILAIISASSTVIQAVGIFFTPEVTSHTRVKRNK